MNVPEWKTSAESTATEMPIHTALNRRTRRLLQRAQQKVAGIATASEAQQSRVNSSMLVV